MENRPFSYCIFPLGDSALTIDFGNAVEETINRRVIGMFNQLRRHPLPCVMDAVPAYSSLTLFYDIGIVRKSAPAGITAFQWMKEKAEAWMEVPLPEESFEEREMRIPVCYEDEMAADKAFVLQEKNINENELINLHSGISYRVYMLGFLPGFAYMGKLDGRLTLPRKPQPVMVKAGSIAIAGMQTGIYPLDSPGGWQVIGRTPLRLFNREWEDPALLRAGDRVTFYPVSKEEFHALENDIVT